MSLFVLRTSRALPSFLPEIAQPFEEVGVRWTRFTEDGHETTDHLSASCSIQQVLSALMYLGAGRSSGVLRQDVPYLNRFTAPVLPFEVLPPWPFNDPSHIFPATWPAIWPAIWLLGRG